MATEFNAKRAQMELVTAAREMYDLFAARERSAEQRFAEAEAEFAAVRKMRAYCLERLNTEKAKLKAIEDAETGAQ